MGGWLNMSEFISIPIQRASLNRKGYIHVSGTRASAFYQPTPYTRVNQGNVGLMKPRRSLHSFQLQTFVARSATSLTYTASCLELMTKLQLTLESSNHLRVDLITYCFI